MSEKTEQEAKECTRHDVCKGCAHCSPEGESKNCVGEDSCLDFQVYKDATLAEWKKEFELTDCH